MEMSHAHAVGLFAHQTNLHSLGKLECEPMPNVMAALQNIGGAQCSTPQSLADAHYWSAVPVTVRRRETR